MKYSMGQLMQLEHSNKIFSLEVEELKKNPWNNWNTLVITFGCFISFINTDGTGCRKLSFFTKRG